MLGTQKTRCRKKAGWGAARKPAVRKSPVKKVAAKKAVKRVATKKVVAKKPRVSRSSSVKKASCAVACHKNHKHTAACKKVCSSSATRKVGSKSRVRTAHGWRQQLMRLMAK